ncbi:hypothetical protein FACS1894127_7050 [Clostridia bacterium]|nr:hypothetical protein FACS1894127_7050 [Clostridia bacterium]
MKNKIFKRSFGAAALIAAVCILTATTVFAAWYLTKPSEIANLIGDQALSAAFESDTAVNINKSITNGGYIFTLLATVSGEDISDMPYYVDGEISNSRTYAVAAVQNADGSPMSIEAVGGFLATPLIKGLEPWKYNIVTLNGGKFATTIDGVLYLVVECEDITAFADRGLYFAICTDAFVSNNVFSFDKGTGEISVNPSYDGASAVFDLPIDKALADPEKAAKFLENKQIESVTVLSTDGGILWESPKEPAYLFSEED